MFKSDAPTARASAAEPGVASELGARPPELPTSPLKFVMHAVVGLRHMYIGLVVLEALNAACTMLLPQALGRIVTGIGKAGAVRSASIPELQRPLMWFFLLALGDLIATRLSGGLTLRLGPRQRQRVTRDLYAYLQHHSQRYLSDNFAGALAHRISETSSSVSSTLFMLLVEFWPVATGLCVSMTLLSRAHVMLAVMVGGWTVVFFAISVRMARRAQPFALAAAAARSETSGKVVDAVTNLASTRLFARLGYERRYLDGYLGRELTAVGRSIGYSERVRWFQSGATTLLKLAVLYYALQLWAANEIDVGDFVMATSLSLLVIADVRGLSRRFLDFFENIGNIQNGVNTLLKPHEIVDAASAREEQLALGKIEYRDVSFAYLEGRPIFTGLSVTIQAGQHVGLVGFSGSGKSTFVQLLLRQYDVQQGQIAIDGHDIKELQQASLHTQVGLIPQEPQLFHRSLLENIRYGRIDASDAEVFEAAKQAHAHDFISAMQQGYDSLVGERGVKLSGGQRQRVAIARVLLKGAPIIVLDEATSSLDSVTEQAIQETFGGVLRGKTVVVIAHRLSTIARLDRILVMHEGRIIEDGTHVEQLLALRGHYHRMWTMQSGGFLPKDAGSKLERTDSSAA
jgi:ATP-binding cassette subfamily B protein